MFIGVLYTKDIMTQWPRLSSYYCISVFRTYIVEQYKEFYANDICKSKPDVCVWIKEQVQNNKYWIRKEDRMWWDMMGCWEKENNNLDWSCKNWIEKSLSQNPINVFPLLALCCLLKIRDNTIKKAYRKLQWGKIIITKKYRKLQ